MPRVSQKRKLFKLFEESLLNDLLSNELFCENEENKKQKEDQIMDDYLMVVAISEETRYSVPFLHNSVPKSTQFLSDVLWQFDDSRFQQFARVSRSTFDFIFQLIENDEIFNGPHSSKQFPLKTQLVIVLYRLGSSGEGASIAKIASLFGVGDGGTIQNYTDRIFNAILKHKNKYLFWPDAAERKEIVKKTSLELPNCIGYVDGTEIPLAEKPTQDPEAYFSRKQSYSLKVQAVCDFKFQIRHMVLGYPGSVHDARIFNNSEISHCSFFSSGEWLAGDSAYKLSPTLLTPFRQNSRDLSSVERNFFNKTFSRYRIRIEHCFGRLKERFNSLKCLKLQIKDENGIRKANKWILCCALLHNIITECNDNLHLDLIEEPEEDDEEDESTAQTTTVNSEGEAKRRELCELLYALCNNE